MKYVTLLYLVLLAGCSALEPTPPRCAYGEKPNPYGYAGEPVRVCACQAGAVIPDVCGGGIAVDSVYQEER